MELRRGRKQNIQHSTFNFEHPMKGPLHFRDSMLNVECSMFPLGFLRPILTEQPGATESQCLPPIPVNPDVAAPVRGPVSGNPDGLRTRTNDPPAGNPNPSLVPLPYSGHPNIIRAGSRAYHFHLRRRRRFGYAASVGGSRRRFGSGRFTGGNRCAGSSDSRFAGRNGRRPGDVNDSPLNASGPEQKQGAEHARSYCQNRFHHHWHS
jgi:hypothetical protein